MEQVLALPVVLVQERAQAGLELAQRWQLLRVVNTQLLSEAAVVVAQVPVATDQKVAILYLVPSPQQVVDMVD